MKRTDFRLGPNEMNTRKQKLECWDMEARSLGELGHGTDIC